MKAEKNKNMNDKVKEKLTKVYELVKRGVEGERQSAEKMLKKLLEKYNISEDELTIIYLFIFVF